MKRTQTLTLSLLALLVAAVACADEANPLIRGTLNPGLEVLAPLALSESDGILVVPRWQSNDVLGSANRFEKYVAAPAGGYLERVQIIGGKSGRDSLLLRLDAPGQPVTRGLLSWESFYPVARAELSGSRYHFHLYPLSGEAVRQDLRLGGKTMLADGKTMANLTARTSYLRLPKPGSTLNHTVGNYRLDVARPVGAGDLSVILALRDYVSRDGLQPRTSWTYYGLRYGLELPRVATLGAEYAITSIARGIQRPTVRAWGINATSPAGSTLVATASLAGRRLSGAVEQNGYTRGANTGRLEARYSGIRGLSLRAGYDRTEYDRVNHDQTAVDEPVWHTVWASASYRPVRRWRIVGRASHRSTPNPPTSGLVDPEPLAFDLDRTAEIRLEGSPTDSSGVYLGNRARFRKNTRRNVEVQTDSASVGGWVQVGERVSLNADYGLQHVDSRNFILQGALADSWVTTIGGTVTLSPRLWAEATYSNYRASRAQDIHQNAWGIGLHRRVGRDVTWDLGFRRDVFDDFTSPTLGYSADVITVGGSGRF